MKVEDTDKKEYPDLAGKEVEFIIFPLLLTDYLFISRSCWETLFREYGLVLAFYVSARFDKAVSDSNEIPLYTKADLVA